jgi:hypothetical protein
MPSVMRHPLGLFAVFASCAAGLTGCHRHAADPREAHDDWCEENPQSIEYVPQGMKPTRPYRVIGMVDAFWFASAAGRAKTLQVKACKLSADAVIDATPDDRPVIVTETQTPTIWGPSEQRTIETGEPRRHPGEGIAIKYLDVQPAPPLLSWFSRQLSRFLRLHRVPPFRRIRLPPLRACLFNASIFRVLGEAINASCRRA